MIIINNDYFLKKIRKENQLPQASNDLKFDPVELVSEFLKGLLKREQEVLKRRFALHGKERDTLENIGKNYSITRERVRQIELSGLKKLKSIITKEEEALKLNAVKIAMGNILDEYGGLMREDYLLINILNLFEQANENIYKQNLLFVISYLLNDEWKKNFQDPDYETFWYLRDVNLEIMKNSVNHLIEFFNEHKQPMHLEELVKNIHNHNLYSERIVKELALNDYKYRGSNDNLSEIISNNERRERVKRMIISYLHISKKLNKNVLEQWGLTQWNIISPKRMNDKIYLVLKRENKPLHFIEIAKKINELAFDGKVAYPATVHNELILDKRYILVGRGVYALRDWGYNDGTVSEVIRTILIQSNEPLDKEELIEKVLSQRMVRKATIVLALTDRSKFKKNNEGKYMLV